METVLMSIRLSASISCTDPTYKEWKPRLAAGIPHALRAHGSYLQGMETHKSNQDIIYYMRNLRTDPTYKEWKRVEHYIETLKRYKVHGSYLQGMETARAPENSRYT